MISDAALDALKERNPVYDYAGSRVRLRSKGRHRYVGPCPVCSEDAQSKTAQRFECDADKWVCAVCGDGGDVLKLVSKCEGVSFLAAVDRLGGAREETPTPATARRAGLRAFQAGAALDVPTMYGDATLREAYCAGWRDGERRQNYEVMARERERERLYRFWTHGARWLNTPVESYLASRGLILPDNARLRFHPNMPMFADGREREPLLVHRGPAMLAPFRDAEGLFRGLHITWLDPHGPKGKAAIVHPLTGEVLPAKKMRGTKRGCYLDLGGASDPLREIAGEGTETVAAVYTALMRAGRDLSHTALRAAGDLGNLAGKALATVAHPTLKTAGNRPQRVPGPDPDLTSPAMPVSDSVTDLVLLGDGDSEPFMTRHALTRAARRNARDGRVIRVRFAPDGLDFNDLIQGKTDD